MSSSQSRESTPWLFALLTALGLSLPFASFTTKLADTTDEGKTAVAGPAGAMDGAPRKDEWEEVVKDVPAERVDFLIATLPDPLDSRFGFQFDLRMEAIQRAAETKGYVMDRFWYPWERGKAGGGPAEQDVPKAKAGSAPAAARSRAHEHSPGWVLFRANDRWLVLLVVGELPTAGIHRSAFQESLDRIARWRKPWFRVMGPTFTGSRSSLEEALRTWSEANDAAPPAARRFVVYSGSASGIDQPTFEANCCPAEVTFHSAVHHDGLVMGTLLAFLSRTVGRGKVALLCESNTGYGRSVASDLPAATFIPFPLHISGVRTAFDRQKQQEKTTGQLQLPSLAGRVRIPFDDPPGTRDALPSLAPSMTAVTAELMLSRILTTVSRENYRFVGLLASDSRDKIFLASVIRQYCPDVQLFTTQADLLFTHPEYSQAMRGALIGSTYPLFPRSQRWTYPHRGDERRLLFSRQGEQGCYNAVLALLAEDPGQPRFALDAPFLDYGEPFVDYDAASATPKPPHMEPSIWISMVGQRGLWPVEYSVPDYSEQKGNAKYKGYVIPVMRAEAGENGAGARFVTQFPSAWISALVGVGLLCLGLCGKALRRIDVPWYEPWKILERVPPPGADGPPEANAAEKWCYAWWCLAFTAVLYFYVCRVAFIALGWEWRWLWLLVGALVLLLPLLLAYGASAAAFVRAWPRKGGPRHGLLPGLVSRLTAATPLVIAVLATAVVCVLLPTQDGRQYPLFERATNLASGISPMLPAFFLGVGLCCWSFFQLRRRDFLGCYHVPRPFTPPRASGSGETAGAAGIQRASGDILQALAAPGPALVGSWVFWIVCLLFGLALGKLATRFLWPIEDAAYTVLMGAGFVFFACCVAFSFVHLHVLWQRIQHLHKEVLRLPMVSAFDRLPPRISGMFGRYFSARRPRFSLLDTPIHQAVLLAKEYKQNWADLLLDSQLCDKLKVQLATTAELATKFRNERKGGEPACIFASETYAELRGTAYVCTLALEQVWARQPVRQAFGDAGDKADAEPLYTAELPEVSDPEAQKAARHWFRLAEDFLAMQVVLFISQFMVQVRNLVTCLTVCAILLLLVVTSYPFQPQGLLLVFALTVVGLVGFRVVTLLVQMDRDELLSRISKTTPNRVTFDRAFLQNNLTYVLPLAVVALGQFPEVWDFLNSLVGPVLGVLK